MFFGHESSEYAKDDSTATQTPIALINAATAKIIKTRFCELDTQDTQINLTIKAREHDATQGIVGKAFDLLAALKTNFLDNPNSNEILLIGQAGSGKTNITRRLITHCETATQTDKFIPLWIPLISLDLPNKKNIIEQYLHQLLFTHPEKEREELICHLKTEKLLLIMDGYDELPLHLQEICIHPKGSYWDTIWPGQLKIVYTSRKEALPADYKKYFQLSTQPLLEYHLQPINDEQITDAITQYLAHYPKEGWDKARYEKYLALPNIKNCLNTPFFLHVVISAIPAIIESTQAETELQTGILARHKIYKLFLEKHYERETGKFAEEKMAKFEEQKLADSFNELPEAEQKHWKSYKNPILVWRINQFVKELATAMFNRQINCITWHPITMDHQEQTAQAHLIEETTVKSTEQSSNPEWLAPFFDHTKFPELRYISPRIPFLLIKEDTYAPYHLSIIEFYAAQHIFSGALTGACFLAGRNLNAINIQTLADTEILTQLIDLTRHDADFSAALYQIIRLSIYEPDIWRAAANAATLLNYAGKSFSNMDLRRVRIGGHDNAMQPPEYWGADLSHAILYGANLQEADCRYVNFTGANLAQVNFTGALLDGIILGEKPHLSGEFFAYSADKKYLFTAYLIPIGFNIHITKLKMFCGKTQTLLKTWKHTEKVTSLALSHNANHAATSHGNEISVWQPLTGKCIATLRGHSRPVIALAYSADDNQLASGSLDGVVKIWLTNQNTCLFTIALLDAVIALDYNSACFNLLIVTRNKILQWDTGENSHLATIREQALNPGVSIIYMDKQTQFALGCWNGDIEIWDLQEKKIIQTLKKHTEVVTSLHYISLDSLKKGGILSASSDKSIFLWDLNTNQAIKKIFTHWKPVASVNYYVEDNKLSLIYSTGASKLRLLLEHSKKCDSFDEYIHEVINTQQTEYGAISINTAMGFLDALGFSKNKLNFIDMLNYKKSKNRSNFVNIIQQCANDVLVTASCNSELSFWNMDTGKNFMIFTGQQAPILSITSFPDGMLVAADKFGCYLWDTQNLTLLRFIQASDVSYLSNYQNDSNKLLIINTNNGRTIVYDINNKKVTHDLTVINEKILKCVITSNPKTGQDYLAILSKNHLCIRSIPDFNIVSLLDVAIKEPFDLSINANLLAITSPVPIRTFLINIDPAKFVGSSPRHKDIISGVSFSNSGLLLATASADCIMILNSQSRKSEAILLTDSYALSFSWTQDDTRLAIGYFNGNLQLWSIKKQKEHYFFTLDWQSKPCFFTAGLNWNRVTGLANNANLLFQQHRYQCRNYEPRKIIGTPFNANTLASADVLDDRNKRFCLQKGEMNAVMQEKGNNISIKITENQWIISLVRYKPGATDKNNNLHSTNHAWLLIQGLARDETIANTPYYVVLKKIELILDRSNDYFLDNIKGKVILKIKDKNLFDLQQLKDICEARVFECSRETAENLLANVLKEDQEKIAYYLPGRAPSFLGKKYLNCLSWYEEQLTNVNINPKLKTDWISNFVVLPEHYFGVSEKKEQRTCSIM